MLRTSAPLVYLVDDDVDTCDLYTILFDLAGCRVARAATVSGAVALLRRELPDLLLTDWRLPDGSGADICAALEADRRWRRVPVIVVSGTARESVEMALAAHRTPRIVLEKPIDPDTLLAAVHAEIRKSFEGRVQDAAARTRRFARRLQKLVASSGDGRLDPVRLLTRAAEGSDSAVSLLLADDRARYVAAGGATRDLTGYDAAELTSLSVWDLTPAPDTVRSADLWRQFIASGIQHGRYTLRTRHGGTVDATYCAIANVAPGLHLSALTAAPPGPLALG
jgi:DNA-binding response OmpR family regulator